MSIEHILLAIAALTACAALANLMDRRQTQLNELLRAYVQRQIDWNRKRSSKAASTAQKAAANKDVSN